MQHKLKPARENISTFLAAERSKCTWPTLYFLKHLYCVLVLGIVSATLNVWTWLVIYLPHRRNAGDIFDIGGKTRELGIGGD